MYSEDVLAGTAQKRAYLGDRLQGGEESIWWRDPTWHTGGPPHRNYCHNKTEELNRPKVTAKDGKTVCSSMCYDVEVGAVKIVPS